MAAAAAVVRVAQFRGFRGRYTVALASAHPVLVTLVLLPTWTFISVEAAVTLLAVLDAVTPLHRF